MMEYVKKTKHHHAAGMFDKQKLILRRMTSGIVVIPADRACRRSISDAAKFSAQAGAGFPSSCPIRKVKGPQTGRGRSIMTTCGLCYEHVASSNTKNTASLTWIQDAIILLSSHCLSRCSNCSASRHANNVKWLMKRLTPDLMSFLGHSLDSLHRTSRRVTTFLLRPRSVHTAPRQFCSPRRATSLDSPWRVCLDSLGRMARGGAVVPVTHDLDAPSAGSRLFCSGKEIM